MLLEGKEAYAANPQVRHLHTRLARVFVLGSIWDND